MWDWFNDMTTGDWRVDLVALSGLVIAIGVIVRMVVIPTIRTIWRAIVAAPILAMRVGQLVELLETDIQKRIEDIENNNFYTVGKLVEHEAAHSGYTARLDAHDVRLNSLESRLHVAEETLLRPKEVGDELSSNS